ncbi:lipopolysaccharide biosynthesis protein RfbH, partial [Candidatus Woesearchaeota archaeon]|nr:lipopolysaccharide biosynthesis protein RfbH [Candidatus Woesearchaeota archaeon]
MTTQKEKLREQIIQNVEKFCNIAFAEKEFVPGKTRIHYAGRVFDENEISELVDSALDMWLTLGPEGKKFCNEFSKYLGV